MGAGARELEFVASAVPVLELQSREWCAVGLVGGLRVGQHQPKLLAVVRCSVLAGVRHRRQKTES